MENQPFEDISLTTGSIKTCDFLASHVFFQGSTWATIVLSLRGNPPEGALVGRRFWSWHQITWCCRLVSKYDWTVRGLIWAFVCKGFSIVKKWIIQWLCSTVLCIYIQYLSLMIFFSFLQHPIEGEGCTISFCTSWDLPRNGAQKSSVTAKREGGVFVRPRPIEGDMLMLLDDDHAYVPHAIGEDRGCCTLRFSIKTHAGMGYLLDVYEQDGTSASKITRRFLSALETYFPMGFVSLWPSTKTSCTVLQDLSSGHHGTKPCSQTINRMNCGHVECLGIDFLGLPLEQPE